MTGMAPARLRLGMVGGGRGAFIGAVHRIAARLDDRYELVAAAPSSDPETAQSSGRDLRLASDRIYDDFRRMAEVESRRPDGIEVIAVVTPNNLHHPVCSAFLDHGIHVICDKPLTGHLNEAVELAATARRVDRVLGVTYTYAGYPMVREARALVEAGALGEIRIVQTEFALGWLSTAVEDENKQAAWRADPERSGPSLVVGDIGTHCLHLSEFVSGRRVASLLAELRTVVPGRRLEDDAHLLLRFDNGAGGAIWASMVAAGETVGLRIRVYGEKAHLAWDQQRPNELRLVPQGEPVRILERGMAGLSPAARRATRLVAGLPEGYHEAFAVLYRDYADIIEARRDGGHPNPLAFWAPMAEEGVRGVAFIEAALESHAQGGSWIEFDPRI